MYKDHTYKTKQKGKKKKKQQNIQTHKKQQQHDHTAFKIFGSLETFLSAPSLKNHKSKVLNGNDRTTNCTKNFKGRRNTQYKRINSVHMFSTKAHRISMQVTNGEMMHPVVSL